VKRVKQVLFALVGLAVLFGVFAAHYGITLNNEEPICPKKWCPPNP
jgi:hypothetical protein